MISIIISSYQPQFFDALQKNIEETCGVEFEVIKIDNAGKMGICEAYNIGGAEAKFQNLLFVHEDILFRTENWGSKLISHLEEPQTGVVGVAGSDYVPFAPSGWFICSGKNMFVNYIQNNREGSKPKLESSFQEKKVKAISLDGVFLAMRKKVFDEFGFSKFLHGYHGYDIEISRNVATKFQNYVIGDILIEHFSKGNADEKWFSDIISIHQRQKKISWQDTQPEIEFGSFRDFVKLYFRFNGISLKNTFKTLAFMPKDKITSKMKWELLKDYFKYFRYKTYYQNAFIKEQNALQNA